MNPEIPGAPTSAEPHAAPAVAGADAPQAATTEASPLPSGDAPAPDAVPDDLRELPPDAPSEATPATPVEAGESAVAPAAAAEAGKPGLTPAACATRLAELFPALFIAPGAPGPAKPIKLRIHADIQARAPGVFSKRVLGLFFSRYTTTNAYLKALAAAPHRFDLDGEPAGEIAAEHRQAATEELARRHALAAQRRAAQRPPARREAQAPEGASAPGERREPRPAGQRDPGQDARLAERAARPQRPPQAPRMRDDRQRPERATGARPPRSGEQTAPHRRAERATPVRDTAPPAAALPTDPAQRERAMLLRSFESSPLSKANFCALKGLSEATLDAALEQAQAERRGNGR